eukprot:SAG22_NODE_28_length_28728_cov_19.603619_21_plen_177_part_00
MKQRAVLPVARVTCVQRAIMKQTVPGATARGYTYDGARFMTQHYCTDHGRRVLPPVGGFFSLSLVGLVAVAVDRHTLVDPGRHLGPRVVDPAKVVVLAQPLLGEVVVVPGRHRVGRVVVDRHVDQEFEEEDCVLCRRPDGPIANSSDSCQSEILPVVRLRLLCVCVCLPCPSPFIN